MSASRHHLMDQALDMTRRMAALGEENDWQAVIALESQRRILLEQAFATHAPADERVAQSIRAILDLDKRLMTQSIEARERVAGQIGQASKGRTAANAYRAAGS